MTVLFVVLFVVQVGPRQAGVQLAEFLLIAFPALTTATAGSVLTVLLLIALPPPRGGIARVGPSITARPDSEHPR